MILSSFNCKVNVLFQAQFLQTDTNLAVITVRYQKLYDLQNAAGKQQQRQEQISGCSQEGKGTVLFLILGQGRILQKRQGFTFDSTITI